MKFGFVVENGGQRVTVPVIEADSEQDARRVLAISMSPLWKVVKVESDPFMWDNCLYHGQAVGHSHGFCTADSCY